VPGPWTHRDVWANGIRLHIAEAGSGPLVLLLHGFGEFWWTWRHQLAGLADAGFHAVAVDLRGCGDSDKPPRGYDAWTMAGDLAALVRGLGATRAAVIGHGEGGLLGWALAAVHPRVVACLAVLAAPHPLALRSAIGRGLTRPWSAANRAALARCAPIFGMQLPWLPEYRLRRHDGALIETYLRTWSGPRWTHAPEFQEVCARSRQAIRVPAAAHCAVEPWRWAVRAQLRADGRRFATALDRTLELPVLAVHGALGPLEPAARESARWAIGKYEYQLLPDVGHFPHQEVPHTTTRLLAGFLAEHGPAG
jgi:pimeloyl-ACP methyl ester carboxylesterase